MTYRSPLVAAALALFSEPIVVDDEALPRGPTPWAATAGVHAGSTPGVLRVVAASPSQSAAEEIDFATAMGEMGIGPRVMYVNSNRTAFVMRRVQTTRNPFEQNPESIAILAGALAHFHGLSPELAPKYGPLRTEIAMDSIAWEMLPKDLSVFRSLRESYSVQASECCVAQNSLIHGDLNPGNVLQTDTDAFLIDFDHVMKGNPFFDLATIAEWACDSDAARLHLLTKYLGRTPSPDDLRTLENARIAVLARYALVTLSFANLRGAPPLESIRALGDRPFHFAEDASNRNLSIFRLACAFAFAATLVIEQRA